MHDVARQFFADLRDSQCTNVVASVRVPDNVERPGALPISFHILLQVPVLPYPARQYTSFRNNPH